MYAVTYGGSVPAGSRVFLCVDQPSNRMEVFKTWSKAVQLPQLLRLFRNCVKWAQDVDCWLVAEGGSETVTSQVRQIRTPVQPLFWPTNTRKLWNEVPKLTYPGNGYGRLLSSVYEGVRYFYIAGGFETVQERRGFDCTTFPEALYCDKFPNGYPNLGAGQSGPVIADALGAESVGAEGVSGAALRQFFLDRNDEIRVYIVWRHYTHILLCKIDTMANSRWFHEFNYGGYIRTPVSERELEGTFTARALPMKDFDFTNRVETLGGQAQAGNKPGNKPGAGAGAGTGGGNGGNGSNGGGSNSGGKTYTVVSGDSLSLIAGRFYNDVLLWPVIYDANKSVIGSNPNLIKPGQKYQIPGISGYSSSQLSAIRTRGRNC